MNDAGTLRTELDRGLASVCFSHPKGNSLPLDLLRRMSDEISRLGREPEVRAILLESDGEAAFCAGASFSELTALRSVEAAKEFFSGFAHLLGAMIAARQPVITRAHQRSVGGGVGILAASDYVIAHREASVKLSEISIGIGPFVVGPVIEHKIGPGHFTAMTLDGGWRSADWALERGLYAALCDTREDLDAAITSLGHSLADSSADALTRIKRTIWGEPARWTELLLSRATHSAELVLSPFAQNAIAALQRR